MHAETEWYRSINKLTQNNNFNVEGREILPFISNPDNNDNFSIYTVFKTRERGNCNGNKKRNTKGIGSCISPKNTDS